MSAQCEVTAKRAAGSSMSLFERYLSSGNRSDPPAFRALTPALSQGGEGVKGGGLNGYEFGFDSGAALATVVGVLVEVPVMLSVVKIVNQTKGWYEAGLSS